MNDLTRTVASLTLELQVITDLLEGPLLPADSLHKMANKMVKLAERTRMLAIELDRVASALLHTSVTVPDTPCTGSIAFCLCPAHLARRTAMSIAHRKVQYAVEKKRLPPPSTLLCADCGAQAEQYEHRDYNKPLDVEPICKSCNTKRGSATWTDATL